MRTGDLRAYGQTGELSVDLLYLFAQALETYLGPDCCVRAKNHVRRDRAVPGFRPAGWRRAELPRVQILPFQSRSRAWCLYVVHLRAAARAGAVVQGLRAVHAPAAAFESTERMLCENYRVPAIELHVLELDPGCDVALLAGALLAASDCPIKIGQAVSPRLVQETHEVCTRTLRWCIEAANPSVDDCFRTKPELGELFRGLFREILPGAEKERPDTKVSQPARWSLRKRRGSAVESEPEEKAKGETRASGASASGGADGPLIQEVPPRGTMPAQGPEMSKGCAGKEFGDRLPTPQGVPTTLGPAGAQSEPRTGDEPRGPPEGKAKSLLKRPKARPAEAPRASSPEEVAGGKPCLLYTSDAADE